ncbi:MAG: glutamate decarboxylase [Desulfotomaculaceae bacterium]|nr:glutamate decarboxylase [Desulfotomaculaceae bacterium]
MWTVVYIAPSLKEAEKMEKLLSTEGFLVKLRTIGLPQANDACSVEILVPESEVDEALETINTI